MRRAQTPRSANFPQSLVPSQAQLAAGSWEYKHSRAITALAPGVHPLYSLAGSAPAAAATPVAAERVRRSSSARGERPGAAGTGTHAAAGAQGAHVAGTTGPSSTHRRLLLLNLLGSRMSSTEKEVGRGGAAGRAAPAPSGTAGTVSLAASGGIPARGKMGSSARPSIASRAVAAGAGGAGPEPGPGGGGGSAGTSPGAAGPLVLMPASGRSGGSGPAAYWAPIPAPHKNSSAQLFSALRSSWLKLPGVASATASGARRARPVHLWRPRRRRPRAHTLHTRAPAGGRGVPPPSLARTPNWLGNGPRRSRRTWCGTHGLSRRAGQTDALPGATAQSAGGCRGQHRAVAPLPSWKMRARLLGEGGGDSPAFK